MRNRNPMYRRPGPGPGPGMDDHPMEQESMPNYYDYGHNGHKHHRHHWPRWWYYNDYDWYDNDPFDDDWYYFSKVYRQGVEHGRNQAMKLAAQSNCMPTVPPAPTPPPSEPTKG